MPSLFRRSNGIYYICYEDEGKRRWKSTNQTHKADALEELFQFEKLRSEYKTRTPLESFFKDFLAHTEVTWPQKTLEIYKRASHRFHHLVGNKLLTSITPKEVDLYRTARAKEVAPARVNIELHALRAAFSTAVRWKLITENPFKKVPLFRVPDQMPIYFSKEDFKKFVPVI
jgi:site-specific recombinase XerD